MGNYFVSNYPPFSFWKPEFVPDVLAALERPPASPLAPLGIYLHIPFCRKRCHFCYFKVYTDKDSAAIRGYIDAALKELALYAAKPIIGGRKANFVYFGGGTPSYLSVDQLQHLTGSMKELISWDEAEEVTFECEPGTLTSHKLKAIRELGVTRLSLGVENFDDHILEINGRAHHSKEIARAYSYACELGFPQINIDLIAGMVEETEANWRECVRKTIEMSPDSVTIYQMEVPYNTTIYQEMKAAGKLVAPVADWETKRGWVASAFAELEQAGYTVGSAYTAVKNKETARFLYRDRLWAGADLIGLGVASFGHLQGTHYQNQHDFEPYVNAVHSGRLSHLPGHDAERRRAVDPRVHFATQAGPHPLRLFPEKIRRRCPPAFCPAAARFAGLGFWAGRGRRGGAEPRRAAPGGQAVARILPARTQERQIRLRMKAAKEEMPPPLRRSPSIRIFIRWTNFTRSAARRCRSSSRVEPDEVPEPYRSLLVHKADMTSTLERFYQETLHIEVLARRVRGKLNIAGKWCWCLDRRKKRVEFGAIKIFLDLFPAGAVGRFCASGSRWAGFSTGSTSRLPAGPGPSCGWRRINILTPPCNCRGRTFSMAAAIRWSMRGSGPWRRSWKFCRRNHP